MRRWRVVQVFQALTCIWNRTNCIFFLKMQTRFSFSTVVFYYCVTRWNVFISGLTDNKVITERIRFCTFYCSTSLHKWAAVSLTSGQTHLIEPRASVLDLIRLHSSRLLSLGERRRQLFHHWLSKKQKVQKTILWLCSLLWMLLLCFSPLCSSAEKLTKCRRDKQTQVNERTQATRKYCHPSFSIPAAGDIRQVRQLFGGFL